MFRFALILLFIGGIVSVSSAQVILDTVAYTPAGDTAAFWAQIPANYNPAHPPAIVVEWHGLGGNQYEMQGTEYAINCNQRGWIIAAFMGPNDRHWNTARAQAHCKAMLDSIYHWYPFSMDSIYMIGGSMGGAGGQVWHNNNCGLSDYLIAATYGGSHILDCDLRQTQYLDAGHINNSMIAAFGGVPRDNDSVAFQYHRASAIYFADTSQSMHFNSLHLPVYNTWGTSDGDYLTEWVAYGRPAQTWDSLRRADGADMTVAVCSGIDGHGGNVLIPDSVLQWLSHFTVNRYPETLNINADESDEYYWTRVWLADTNHVWDWNMGRYRVERNFAERRLDIRLVRKISAIDVEFQFPWPQFDSLSGHWIKEGNLAMPVVRIRLTNVPPVTAVKFNGSDYAFTYARDTLSVNLWEDGDYKVLFDLNAHPQPSVLPGTIRLANAYPNPFNSQISFDIESPHAGNVELMFYDVLGRCAQSRMVAVHAGTQRVVYDVKGLSSGRYFVRLNGAAASPVSILLLK